MSSRFKDPNIVPPGGRYFYTVPQTGAAFEAFDRYRLLDDVTRHLRASGLPVPETLAADMEDFMCQRLPSGFCKGDSGPWRPYITSHSLREFTRMLFRRAGNRATVEPRQADERAKTCLSCPENLRGVCTTCDGLEGFVRTLVGVHRATPYDAALGACGRCGCLLRVKVHIPIEHLAPTSKITEYPEGCWIRRELSGLAEAAAEDVDAALENAEPGELLMDGEPLEDS